MNKLWTKNRFYAHAFDATTIRLIQITTTQEIEEPYRSGSCLAIRFPILNFSLALGIWKNQQEEEAALLNAVGGRIIGDIDALEKEEKENVLP